MSVAVSQHKNFVGGEWDHARMKHVMAKID